MPTVTGFTALARLNSGPNSGKDGLHLTNNSTSPVEVTGSGLVDGMAVSVTYGTAISWAGTLNITNNKCTANLKCTNTYEPPTPEDDGGGLGDPEDVSVTVGDAQPIVTPVNLGP